MTWVFFAFLTALFRSLTDVAGKFGLKIFLRSLPTNCSVKNDFAFSNPFADTKNVLQFRNVFPGIDL